MKMIRQVLKGMSYYGKAIHFIYSNRLGWFFIFPVVLNGLLFWGGFYFSGTMVTEAQKSLLEFTEIGSGDFFLKEALFFLINLFIRILFLLAFAMFGGYITLVFLSPFLSILSDKCHSILTGNKSVFSLKQFILDIFRGVRLAIRNLFLQTSIMVLLIIISFIPPAGFITPLAMFIVSAYFYGFSFLDYSLERRKFSIRESAEFVNENRGIAIGIGAIFSLLLLIPFAGSLLAGFGAIFSTVAASILMDKTESV